MTPRNAGVACVLVAWVACAVPSAVLAQCPNPTARLVNIDNQVEYKAASAAVFAPASLNLDVCRGDAVRTGDRSRATIVFVDNTRLVIDQNTEWIVREPPQQGRTLIDLIRGAILFFTRQPRSLDIRTPFVNASVEGTEFLVRVEADRTLVTVFEGRVGLSNPSGDTGSAANESGGRDRRPRSGATRRRAAARCGAVGAVLPADSRGGFLRATRQDSRVSA